MSWKAFLVGGILGATIGAGTMAFVADYYSSPVKIYDRVVGGENYRIVKNRFGDTTVMENNETYQEHVFLPFDKNTGGENRVKVKERDKLEKKVLSIK